jgi:tetratricopeptide (TPR) repeat protein
MIGKRLSRLSPECYQVLSAASVIGRDFRLDTLEDVLSLDEETMIAAIEEATQAGILHDVSTPPLIRYRFSHALFQQSLYGELSAPRRRRRHQAVARALEVQYGRRSDEHAAELADHFSYSTDPSDLEAAIRFAELAARRATSVFDYGEAARLLERALVVQSVLDGDDATRRCDLLLLLAEALMRGSDARRATEVVLEEAFELAEAAGSAERAGQACNLAYLAMTRYLGNTAAVSAPQYRAWLERSSAYASPGTATAVIDGIYRGAQLGALGNFDERLQVLVEALKVARSLEDWGLCFFVGTSIFQLTLVPPHHQALLRDLALDAETWHRGVLIQGLSPTLGHLATIALANGDRPRADAVWAEIPVLAERTRDRIPIGNALVNEILEATLDGRLEDAIAKTDESLALSYGNRPSTWQLSLPSMIYLGSRERARDCLETYRDSPLPHGATEDWGYQRAIAVLTMAFAGDQAAADELRRTIAGYRGRGSLGGLPLPALTQLLQAAVILRDRESAALLLPELEEAAGLLTALYLTCVARHVGAAQALLGHVDAARASYVRAIEVCAHAGFQPELALAHLQLADLLMEHYPQERASAKEHLNIATTGFQAMGMQPSAEEAARLKLQTRG